MMRDLVFIVLKFLKNLVVVVHLEIQVVTHHLLYYSTFIYIIHLSKNNQD